MSHATQSVIPAPTVVISPDCLRGNGDVRSRTPPGQTLTSKWPVLHYGNVPQISREEWRLRIFGLVENEIELTWSEFAALPRTHVKCDIHCVTHWSRLDNIFSGVATKTLLALVKPKPEATFVIQHAWSDPMRDWTTNVPLAEFAQEDCLLATEHDGLPISAEHGAPVRAVVPRLYFWKGAKWITCIELTDKDVAGFWEVNGYHMHGDPWTEERFGW